MNSWTREVYHVESFPDHLKYLPFSWDFGDDVVKYFQIHLLGCHPQNADLFTKLLKGLFAYSYLMASFLHDGLGGSINNQQFDSSSLFGWEQFSYNAEN